MKRCMYCGNENDDSSQNCSKCGNRLIDIPAGQTPSVEEVPEEMTAEQNGQQEERMPEIPTEEPVNTETYPAGGMGIVPPQEARPGYGQPDNPQAYNYSQPYAGQAYGEQPGAVPYSAQPYAGSGMQQNPAGGYGVQQQYGGQAYGYQNGAQAQTPQYGQMPAQGAGSRGGYGQMPLTGGGKQILLKARKMVKSPLFFLAMLFHTIMTVATILSIVTGNVAESVNNIQNSVQTIAGKNVALTFLNGIIDMVEGFNPMIVIAGNLVLFIPTLLLCIGLWMMFFSTSSVKEQISTAGYTMVKVMLILKFIGFCILLTLGLILCVAFVVAAGASSSTASIIVGIVALIIMIIVSVLVIMYYVQSLYSIKVIRMNAKNGADAGTLPLYVPVISILVCIVTVLSMLPMAPDDYIGLLQSGASAAWMLFAGIWLLVYRAKVHK